jgi:ABC-type transport system substrate-binding protein
MASWPRDPGRELPTLVEIVASYWTQVGVKVQIVPQDYAAFRPGWFAGKIPNTVFPLSLQTFYPSYAVILQRWYAAGSTLALYQNDAINEIVKELGSTRIPGKRSSLFQKAATHLYNNYSEIPIAIPDAIYFASKKVAAWTPPARWYAGYYEYANEAPPVNTPRPYVPKSTMPTY